MPHFYCISRKQARIISTMMLVTPHPDIFSVKHERTDWAQAYIELARIFTRRGTDGYSVRCR